jgi:hypothetical protein
MFVVKVSGAVVEVSGAGRFLLQLSNFSDAVVQSKVRRK